MRYFGVVAGVLLSTFLVSSVFAQSPKLQILSPTEGEVIAGDKVIVRFQVTDFTFVDFRKTDLPKPNQGHLHIWLDQKNQTEENAAKAASAEPYLLTNLLAGDHSLTLELVHSDLSSFAPKLSQTVNFKTVGGAIPTPTPVVTQAAPLSNVGQIAIGVVIGLIAIGGLVFLATRPKS